MYKINDVASSEGSLFQEVFALAVARDWRLSSVESREALLIRLRKGLAYAPGSTYASVLAQKLDEPLSRDVIREALTIRAVFGLEDFALVTKMFGIRMSVGGFISRDAFEAWSRKSTAESAEAFYDENQDQFPNEELIRDDQLFLLGEGYDLAQEEPPVKVLEPVRRPGVLARLFKKSSSADRLDKRQSSELQEIGAAGGGGGGHPAPFEEKKAPVYAPLRQESPDQSPLVERGPVLMGPHHEVEKEGASSPLHGIPFSPSRSFNELELEPGESGRQPGGFNAIPLGGGEGLGGSTLRRRGSGRSGNGSGSGESSPRLGILEGGGGWDGLEDFDREIAGAERSVWSFQRIMDMIRRNVGFRNGFICVLIMFLMTSQGRAIIFSALSSIASGVYSMGSFVAGGVYNFIAGEEEKKMDEEIKSGQPVASGNETTGNKTTGNKTTGNKTAPPGKEEAPTVNPSLAEPDPHSFNIDVYEEIRRDKAKRDALAYTEAIKADRARRARLEDDVTRLEEAASKIDASENITGKRRNGG